MKKFFISVSALLCAVILLFAGISAAVTKTMPKYIDTVGDVNYNEKITGLYLVKQSAARDDNIIIYGSSELKTTDIFTQPANFFKGRRAVGARPAGFQVNLVGRGSCQSIIHAISIAASGDALTGKKVVLITSPQSFVKDGITPDMFMANFSNQQYLELMKAADISPEVKTYISKRVTQLFAEYAAMESGSDGDTYIRWLAEYGAETKQPAYSVRNTALTPYYAFSGYLYGLKDKITSRAVLKTAVAENSQAPQKSENQGGIDWAAEEKRAVAEAKQMSDNNDFGMLNGYYTTNVGSRLSRQRGKEKDLDYSVSMEYDDLRILFEICREKGIKPLFVHVPLNGKWSDFTGFTEERRQKYYGNVRAVAEEYGINVLDLTGFEYEEYFLCDVMHLGWKGWLEVDRALVDFYNES